jgi:hypothetical protein
MGLVLAAFVAGTFLLTVGCGGSTPSKASGPAKPSASEAKKDGDKPPMDGDKKPADGDKKPEDKKP